MSITAIHVPASMVKNPRWAATVHYRHASGLVDVTHDLDEISDLEALVERGPHFDTIDHITITYVLGDGGLTIEQAEQL